MGQQIRTGTIKFEVIKKIGEGSFGSTIKVQDVISKEIYVIKTNELVDKYFENRFIKEYNVLLKMNSSNIVRPKFISYKDDKKLYYAMEYVDGFKINEYLDENPEEINRLFLDVLGTLKIIHAEKLTHGDLSVNNILVTKQGKIKLIDFGMHNDYSSTLTNSIYLKLKEMDAKLNRTLTEEEIKEKYSSHSDLIHFLKLFAQLDNNHFKYSYLCNNLKHAKILKHEMIYKEVEEKEKLSQSKRKIITEFLQMYNINKIKSSFEIKPVTYDEFSNYISSCVLSEIQVNRIFALWIPSSSYEYNITNITIDKLEQLLNVLDNEFVFKNFSNEIKYLVNNTTFEDDLPF